MFAIAVRYLSGRCVATHPANRELPEWPPHPDRLFMALVAAWGETGCNGGEERTLRWLETLPPPDLVASDGEERTATTSYVPVNDMAMPRLRSGRAASEKQAAAGLALLPENRPRKARHFPAVRCRDDTVFFLWQAAVDPGQMAALTGLSAKVTYLGHSSSPVQCWTLPAKETAALKPSWVPARAARGDIRLRVPTAGRFQDLCARFRAGQRPTSGIWAGYEQPRPLASERRCSLFDPSLIMLRQTGGRRFGLETTLSLTRALRDCLIKLWSEAKEGAPAPEWLSGHAPDGKPSQHDHAAFIPLPDVGHEHADGHLLGLAVVMPRWLPSNDAASGFGGILWEPTGEPRPIRLVLGDLGVSELELEDRPSRPVALTPATWSGLGLPPSRRWATVTPICFNRHPKGDSELEMESDIAAACERIGFQGLVEAVVPAPVSMFIGCPTARGFPKLRRKSGGSIRHTHAIITFKEPVTGPVLLGAGRYRGYGLCRPLRSNEVLM
jgi:CRISPR-associated protein Csb2